ncbi:MAG: EpsG family protein [Clostridia bacterium]|nr:EpsG family protein [Clostridia bacterium]
MIYVVALVLMLGLRLCLPRDTTRSRRIFALACFFILTFIAACRAPEVGRDTTLFIQRVFDRIRIRNFTETFALSTWAEPGFRLLCYVLTRFTANGQWLIVVSSVLIHGSVSFFIYRHAKNIYLAFYLYLAMMIYPFYLNIMRQALAIAVLLFAWDFFKKRQILPYAGVVLLAATFHTSALLFLACPLLLLIPVTQKTLRVLIPVTVLFSLLGALFVRPIVHVAKMLLPRYAEYEPTTFDALYWYLAVFALITAYGVYRFYFAKDAVPALGGEDKIDQRGFLTLMMLLGVIVASMMTRFGQLQRIFNYFEVLYLLWLPATVPPATVKEGKRYLIFPKEELLVLAATLAYFLVLLFGRSALWYDALPYRFFWQ